MAPDLRDDNASDKPEGMRAYEVEALAGDVAGLIRALGRTEAGIVGHDWGAVVAWSCAMFHGAMTIRLAILNAPHPVAMLRGLRMLRQLHHSWYVFAFQLPRLPEWAVARHDFAFIRQTFAADGVPAADIERYVGARRQPGAVSAAVHDYRAAIRRGLTGRQAIISPIATPVLAIWLGRPRPRPRQRAGRATCEPGAQRPGRAHPAGLALGAAGGAGAGEPVAARLRAQRSAPPWLPG